MSTIWDLVFVYFNSVFGWDIRSSKFSLSFNKARYFYLSNILCRVCRILQQSTLVLKFSRILQCFLLWKDFALECMVFFFVSVSYANIFSISYIKPRNLTVFEGTIVDFSLFMIKPRLSNNCDVVFSFLMHCSFDLPINKKSSKFMKESKDWDFLLRLSWF